MAEAGGSCCADIHQLKGTVDEELWDVMYYVLAIANCYEIDLEAVIKEKEAINQEKYPSLISFEENR